MFEAIREVSRGQLAGVLEPYERKQRQKPTTSNFQNHLFPYRKLLAGKYLTNYWVTLFFFTAATTAILPYPVHGYRDATVEHL